MFRGTVYYSRRFGCARVTRIGLSLLQVSHQAALVGRKKLAPALFFFFFFARMKVTGFVLLRRLLGGREVVVAVGSNVVNTRN